MEKRIEKQGKGKKKVPSKSRAQAPKKEFRLEVGKWYKAERGSPLEIREVIRDYHGLGFDSYEGFSENDSGSWHKDGSPWTLNGPTHTSFGAIKKQVPPPKSRKAG